MCFWYSYQNWTAFDRYKCCNQNGIRYGRKPLVTSQAGVDSVTSVFPSCHVKILLIKKKNVMILFQKAQWQNTFFYYILLWNIWGRNTASSLCSQEMPFFCREKVTLTIDSNPAALLPAVWGHNICILLAFWVVEMIHNHNVHRIQTIRKLIKYQVWMSSACSSV